MVTYSPADPSETEVQVQQAPVIPGVPHSREAEEAVIGSIMIDPDCFYDVAKFLKGEDFYIHRNKWMWETYEELKNARKPIDLLTVSEVLEKQNKLAEIGGSSYITSLINQVPTSLNVETYGRIVEEHSIRRKMIQAANKIASLAYKGGDIHSNFSEGRKAYENSYQSHSDFTHIRELASKHYDKMQAYADGKQDDVIKTGFVDIDYLLDGGMRGNNFIVVGGRPGMCKTTFVLDVAIHAAKVEKKKVAIFSLEMSNEQVVQRLIAKQGVAMESMRTGKMNDREWPVYTHAIEELSSLDIQMFDYPALNPTQLRAQAFNLYNRFGLDLLIVDYLGLMEGDGKKEDNRTNEVSAISRALKLIARELNIPVMAAAQLNRNVEARTDKRPQLSDLRDSGSIEQDADIVMFTYRDEMYNSDTEKRGIAEVNIAKQRDGKVGPVELIFRAALMKFENAVTKVFRPNEVQQRWQEYTEGD